MFINLLYFFVLAWSPDATPFISGIRKGLKVCLSSLPDVIDTSTNVKLINIIDNGPILSANRKFLINGWRWHSKSVLFFLQRYKLKIIDEQTNAPRSSSLFKCYEFVYEFSWKSLMRYLVYWLGFTDFMFCFILVRIESTIFFPWLKQKLPTVGHYLVNDMLRQHDRICTLANQLRDLCVRHDLCLRPQIDDYEKMGDIVNEMLTCCQDMQAVQV